MTHTAILLISHNLSMNPSCRVVWFDLDLSSTPYKTLKFHEKAIWMLRAIVTK